MKISRRSFLKGSAATTMSLAASRGISLAASATAVTPGPGNKWPGRVVINFNKTAVTGITTAVPAVIQKMVDDAILRLTDQSTVGAAWKAVFPTTLSAASKIAVKITTANSGLPAPHWSSVKAIIDGLQQMDFNGTKFPAANITLYEANVTNPSAAGYTAANLGSSVKIVNDSMVSGGDGALNNRTYASTLKNADFLINVFSPRGHTLANVTLGFKSHFGTYSNPSGLHTSTGASIFQNLRDINSYGVVYKKTVLAVCSGIYGMNEGNGPAGGADNFATYSKTMDPTSTSQCPTTIIMSTDPVSCEMQTVKMMRLNRSPAGKFGVSDMPTYLQASGGVSGALSGTVYNIGVIDEAAMDVRRIINGTTSVAVPGASPSVNGSPAVAVTALPHDGYTFIEYRLPARYRGEEAMVGVYSMNGSLLCENSHTVFGALNHFAWDNKDRTGNPAPSGRYIVRIRAGTTTLTAQFFIGG
jgi:hypothetical protein